MIRRLLSAVFVCAALSFGPAAAFADRERDEPANSPAADTPEEERGTAFERVTGASRENVKGGTMLVIAYVVVWATVFGFVAMQWRRQARVRDELARMEKALEEERKVG